MNTKTQGNQIIEKLTNFNTNLSPTERIVSATAGGALLTYGIKRGDALGVILSIVGGASALRGATGHCQVYDALGINTAKDSFAENKPSKKLLKSLPTGKIEVKKAVTINKSPAELYQFWRNFENLPRFMTHLESVTTTGEKTSHWVAKAPFGTTVEWDAEITFEEENNRIAWKSAEGADIENVGMVEFLPTSTRGTEVKVTLSYDAPAGKIGSVIANFLGEAPKTQIGEDLRRFKQLCETGVITTVEGQTSGRKEKSKSAKA